jgi:hypothetical protein
MFFVLFNIAYWFFPTFAFLRHYSPEGDEATDNLRVRLPNYANVAWAAQHFREIHQIKRDYKSFIGWRSQPFHGETINIEGRYAQRRTINDGVDQSKKVYFFGGSTMWGTGALDDGTIPSQFAAVSGISSQNFGEIGYTAHQSLMLLVQLLQDGHRPDVVVFYDGVNEVVTKCRTEVTPYSDVEEANIDHLLKDSEISPISFRHYFAPLQYVAGWIKAEAMRSIAKSYDCDSDPEKARKIAENLLLDWQMARRLVESFGGKFIGILQPVLFFSQTRLDRLSNFDEPLLQFQTVYPLVEQRMAEDGGFRNLVHALDDDEYVYIDFCHLSPNGNRRIAARIAKFVQP